MIVLIVALFIIFLIAAWVYRVDGLGDAVLAGCFVTILFGGGAMGINAAIAAGDANDKPNRIPVSKLEIRNTDEGQIYFVTADGKDYDFSEVNMEIEPADKTSVVQYKRNCPPMWLSVMCFDSAPVLEIRGSITP